MEKTVEMTGLDVEKLLADAGAQMPGQGGPYIPAPADTATPVARS